MKMLSDLVNYKASTEVAMKINTYQILNFVYSYLQNITEKFEQELFFYWLRIVFSFLKH